MSDYVDTLLKQIKISKSARKITKIGYGWWGFMADMRYKNQKEFSSPDGSLLHAFSIIHEFQKRGIEVHQLYEDRDSHYVGLTAGKQAFQSFSQQKRWEAYSKLIKPNHTVNNNDLELRMPEVDAVLLEWRMPTRYNQLPMEHPEFEPDLILQKFAIQYYRQKNIPVICLDLDYNMTIEDDQLFDFVLEPGFKRGIQHHIDIPFILEDINQFDYKSPSDTVVYIGNRYNRDDAFDLFFGKSTDKLHFQIYGNWLENDRDSGSKWPHVYFYGRIHPYQMRGSYQNALATPLLLKEEYNKYGFMSIRLIESLLFGTIPLLPSQFYSPIEYDLFRIENQDHMVSLLTKDRMFYEGESRIQIRNMALETIKQHDVKYFVDKFLSVL